MFVVELAPRHKRKQTSGIMLDVLTKSKGGRMEIHFESGLKRPRDATELAKLVSEAAIAVRCHAHILPIVLLCPILSRLLVMRLL